MKKILLQVKQSKGFMLGYTMFIGALVLAIITAITYLLPSRQAGTLLTRFSSKAQNLADSGMNHAISQIRQYSMTTKGLAYIDETQPESDARFEYRYEVTMSTCTLPALSPEIIVSATSYGYVTVKQLHKTTTRYVHALIEVNTIFDYFEISTRDLSINRGLDISNADVYGYNLIFNDGVDPIGITKVQKADYFNSVSPTPIPNWVEINGVPGGSAYQQPRKVDLPLINEVIHWYKELASQTTYYADSSGMLNFSDCTHGYKSEFTNTNLVGDIYPPLNGYGVYYSDREIVIGQAGVDTWIHGSMIFVTTHTITIMGNLLKEVDGTDSNGDGFVDADGDLDGKIDDFNNWPLNAEYQVTFASITVPTCLLGLFSGQNINVTAIDGSQVATDIEINASILCSEGEFRALNTTGGYSPSHTAVFKFMGNIMIRDGISFGHKYLDENNRIYQYDTDLRDYGLPNMPFQANILYSYSG